MGDRIAVMKLGVLQQVGSPRELLDHPVNTFVAGFIGSPAMNLFAAEVDERGLVLGGAVLPVADGVRTRIRDGRVTVGVRPEDLVVGGAGDPGIPVKTTLIEELGADGYLFGDAEIAGERVALVVRVDGREHAEPGDLITVSPQPDRVHLFDFESGERIGTLHETREAA